MGNQYCAEVNQGTAVPGELVDAWYCNGTSAEQWDVVPTGVVLGLPDPTNPGWGGKAPLWFYLLREAELVQGGPRLGPIGGRLVGEVIIGILASDKSSYIYDKKPSTPAPPIAPAGSSPWASPPRSPKAPDPGTDISALHWAAHPPLITRGGGHRCT